MTQQLKEKPSLILISGLARSGTTWLGKLFDSHSQTVYRHEPDSVNWLKELPLFIEGDYRRYEALVRDFVSQLVTIRAPKVSSSMPVFPKSFMGPARRFLVKYSLSMVKILSSLGINAEIPRYCIPRQDQDYVLVWKTIESSGRLGLYAEILDKKRIIHILRHPSGIISSRLRGEKLSKFGGYVAAEDYEMFRLLLNTSVGRKHGLSLEQILAMAPVERLAWECLVSMEKAVKDLEGRPDGRIVVYEDLCSKPFEVMQQLFDFCGLNFDPQTHRFLVESTSKTRRSYYSIIKDPLASAYKWKQELNATDQELVRKQLERSPLARFWPD